MKDLKYRIVFMLLNSELKKLRKSQDTPYLFVKGNGKDYPKYLVFTDDANIRQRIHYLI